MGGSELFEKGWIIRKQRYKPDRSEKCRELAAGSLVENIVHENVKRNGNAAGMGEREMPIQSRMVNQDA